MSVDDMWNCRYASNKHILESNDESPHSALITQMTWDDYVRGWMTKPTVVTEADVRDKLLARRIAVEEWREYEEDGWRLRLVDDYTECLLNLTTTAFQSVQNHDLNAACWAVRCALQQDGYQTATMWKADVKSAFRKLAVRPAHQVATAVTWKCDGKHYTSTHRAVPFGGCASVPSWHRYATWVWYFAVWWCELCPMKYVDDFFGPTNSRLKWTTVRVMTIVMYLFGTEFAGRKTYDRWWNDETAQAETMTSAHGNRSQLVRPLLQLRISLPQLTPNPDEAEP